MECSVIPTQDHVWIAARLESVSGESEYYGRLEAMVFQAVTANELTEGWFRLNSVHWQSGDGDLESQTEAGRQWGYSDVAYFRVESLIRLIILTDDFVERLNRKPRASRKSPASGSKRSARKTSSSPRKRPQPKPGGDSGD